MMIMMETRGITLISLMPVLPVILELIIEIWTFLSELIYAVHQKGGWEHTHGEGLKPCVLNPTMTCNVASQAIFHATGLLCKCHITFELESFVKHPFRGKTSFTTLQMTLQLLTTTGTTMVSQTRRQAAAVKIAVKMMATLTRTRTRVRARARTREAHRGVARRQRLARKSLSRAIREGFLAAKKLGRSPLIEKRNASLSSRTCPQQN